MWCVTEIPDASAVEATTVLDASKFGQGPWPKGSVGQEETGFSFFELGKRQGQCLR